MHLCLDDYVTGRWDEEEELADEGLATCRAHGYGFIIWYFQFHKALIAALRGADQEAQMWADELTRLPRDLTAAGPPPGWSQRDCRA